MNASPPTRPRLTLRLDFDASRRLGPGKVALLEAIAESGSISAAGRAHAMSYRRAWLLVEDLNRMFASPLVSARSGGAKGGGAELTALGRTVVALYRAAERKTLEGAEAEIEALSEALARTSRR
jgi:molybdate transport system regulatory protein